MRLVFFIACCRELHSVNFFLFLGLSWVNRSFSFSVSLSNLTKNLKKDWISMKINFRVFFLPISNPLTLSPSSLPYLSDEQSITHETSDCRFRVDYVCLHWNELTQIFYVHVFIWPYTIWYPLEQKGIHCKRRFLVVSFSFKPFRSLPLEDWFDSKIFIMIFSEKLNREN